MRRVSFSTPTLSVLTFLFATFLLHPLSASAVCGVDLSCQFVDCRAPASGVPAGLWGELRPVDLGQLPRNRDSTDWSEWYGQATHLTPHWMSIDAENGWLFTAINFGLEVWDARGSFATAPVRMQSVGGASFPVWLPPVTHESNPVRDVDAPPGYDNLVAVATLEHIGLTVFDTSVKSNPRAVYADHDKSGYAVYAAAIGGRHYAFMATAALGLLAYDMTAAEGNSTACVETTPLQQSCGVYRGRVGTSTAVRYVDGVGSLLALSSGNFDFGFEIWDVTYPSAPRLLLDGLPSTVGVHGVSLWQRAGRTYLAMRVQSGSVAEARIYDLTCLTSGGCASLPAPVWSQPLTGGGTDFFVTHSVAAGDRDFLYFGSSDRCSNARQNEWLFDVSNPAAARDVTPPPAWVAGNLTGYWGWYYRRNPTGFNRVNPRAGVFSGKYFYRAAYSLFDIHELVVDEVFSDGFESGGLGRWSTLVQ